MKFSYDYLKEIFTTIQEKYQDKELSDYGFGRLKQKTKLIKGYHPNEIEYRIRNEEFTFEENNGIKITRFEIIFNNISNYQFARFSLPCGVRQEVIGVRGGKLLLKSSSNKEYVCPLHNNVVMDYDLDYIKAFLDNKVKVECWIDWSVGRPFIIEVKVRNDKRIYEDGIEGLMGHGE